MSSERDIAQPSVDAREPDHPLEDAPERPPTIADRFNAMYAQGGNGATVRRVHREVYGHEYPDEVEPFSQVTRSDLGAIARDLRVGPGQSFVDLGCGEGGPGLWVARETGASLIGIDISSVAVGRAQERVAAFGLEGRARFLVGDVVNTGLPTQSVDGVMSVDTLWMVADKLAVLREMARILHPGARYVFTTWDFGISPPDEPQVADHRPIQHAAGFAVEAYEPTPNWETTYRALIRGYEAAREALVTERGAAAADRFIARTQERAALLPHWQRIYVVARKVESVPSVEGAGDQGPR